MMKTKIYTGITLVFVLVSIAALSGCIDSQPEVKWYLEEIDPNDQMISELLGLSIDEITQLNEDLNIKYYGVVDTDNVINATYVYRQYRDDYSNWSMHYDDCFDDSLPYYKIYCGSWRKLITINAVVVIEGILVELETGYKVVVVTSYGDFTKYQEYMEYEKNL